MKSECSKQALAVDFVNGELGREIAADFQQHLGTCPCCRAEVESTRRLIGTLRSMPEREVSRDLTASILATVHEEKASGSSHRWLLPAAAAAVAIISLLFWRQMHRPSANMPIAVHFPASAPDPAAARLRQAIDWLRTHQEPDGSWDGRKWGGRSEFQIALTALPALALLTSDSGDDPVARKAVEWLRSRQSDNGLFGESGMALPFNHCLATLTLLHASRKPSNPDLRSAIDPAISAILRSQTRDGGWGHFRSPYGNNAITAWHVETLELATSLGWENASSALERGRTWLKSQDNMPSPAVGGGIAHQAQDADSSKVALDLCVTYFITGRLHREDSSDSRIKLAAIREELLNQQITTGSDAGSWPPDDFRGNVGGRLYSTALASMALNGN